MQDNQLKYQSLTVQTNLKKYVKHIWTMEAKPNSGDYYIFRTYASMYPTLIFSQRGNVMPLNREFNGNYLLIGQANKWCRYKISSDFKLLGVTLLPFTLPLLLNLTADTFTNKTFDFDFIAQNDQLKKFCQILEITNFESENINASLTEVTSSINIKDESIISLLTKFSTGSGGVADLTGDSVFMSQRNFERKFKYYSGFTPKSFANLIRLKKSFNSINFEQTTLSDTAYEHGYFDQSHFSNEFKKHTGFQPKIFVKNEKTDNQIWENFVDFFQFLSICPPYLCKNKLNLKNDKE